MAFSNVTGMLFAMIGFGEREGKVRVNFGQSKFEYDIDAHDWTIEETVASIRARVLDSLFDSLSLQATDSVSSMRDSKADYSLETST